MVENGEGKGKGSATRTGPGQEEGHVQGRVQEMKGDSRVMTKKCLLVNLLKLSENFGLSSRKVLCKSP